MSTRVGIEVETPHGVLPLAKFFTQPSRLKGGENRGQEEVEDDLEDLLGDLQNQGLNSDEIIQAVLEEHGIDLAKRTMRNYRRRVAKKKEKPSSPRPLDIFVRIFAEYVLFLAVLSPGFRISR